MWIYKKRIDQIIISVWKKVESFYITYPGNTPPVMKQPAAISEKNSTNSAQCYVTIDLTPI